MGDSNPLRCRALQSCIEHLGGLITRSLAGLTRSILLVLMYQHIFLKRKGGEEEARVENTAFHQDCLKWLRGSLWTHMLNIQSQMAGLMASPSLSDPHSYHTPPNPKTCSVHVFRICRVIHGTDGNKKRRKRKVWRCGWEYTQLYSILVRKYPYVTQSYVQWVYTNIWKKMTKSSLQGIWAEKINNIHRP